MTVLQANSSSLQSVAPEFIILLGLVIVVAFVTSTASAVYAQQRVANTIELGVEGIVGINTMQEVSRAADSPSESESDPEPDISNAIDFVEDPDN